MTSTESPSASTSATIYTDAVLTAPEALAAIAVAAGSRVLGPGTPGAHVLLPGGSLARVEVAKFGDESPIAIDVTGPGAAAAAAALAEALARDGAMSIKRVE